LEAVRLRSLAVETSRSERSIKVIERNMSDVANIQSQIDELKANYDESLDTIWMILAGLLVFFMHAGFSLLESGSVRFKNTNNILAKNLLVVTIGFLCWYVVGWPLAYGTVEDPHKFSGGTQFLMDGFF